MENRLTRIVTCSGDDGSTGLGDGSRISKDSLRIHAIGDIDELNSAIGLFLCEEMPEAIRRELLAIQQDLFDLGGELSLPGHAPISIKKTARIEIFLKKYNADLPPLRNFILPSGSRAGAMSHLCRSICRRAERSIVSLGRSEALSEPLLQYVNRLSDLLFVLARVLSRSEGQQETLWDQTPNK